MNSTDKLLLISQKPKTSHLLHLVLCFITAGLWVPAWVVIGLVNQQRCTNIDRKVKRG